MPRYRVISYDREHQRHRLENDAGEKRWCDIMVNGNFKPGTDPTSLVGKTIEIDEEIAYMTLACGVRIVEES